MPPETTAERLAEIEELARTGKVDTSSLDSARAGGLTIKEWKDYQADRARNMQIANSRVGVEPPAETRVMGTPPAPRVTGSYSGSWAPDAGLALGKAAGALTGVQRFDNDAALAALRDEQVRLLLGQAEEDYDDALAALIADRDFDLAFGGRYSADTSAYDEELGRIGANLAAYNQLLGQSAAGAGSRIDDMIGAGVGEDVIAELANIYAAEAVGGDYLNEIGDKLALGAMGIGTGPVAGDAAAIAGQLARLGELEQQDVRATEVFRDESLAGLAEAARGVEDSRRREASIDVRNREAELARAIAREQERAEKERRLLDATFEYEKNKLVAPTEESIRADMERSEFAAQLDEDVQTGVNVQEIQNNHSSISGSDPTSSAAVNNAVLAAANFSIDDLVRYKRYFDLPDSDTLRLDVTRALFPRTPITQDQIDKVTEELS